MAKQVSFNILRLQQVDYSGSSFVEGSSFVINGDGSWSEQYSSGGPYALAGSGHLTSKELKTLDHLYSKFEHRVGSAVLPSGHEITNEDFYSFDVINANSGFHNIIYDDRSAPALAEADYKTTDTLNDYMVDLVAKYGHGLII